MKKLAIYTVLTGDKEPLGDPLLHLRSYETDLKISLICFTDKPNLESKVWEIRWFDTHSLPPEKSSRRPKILAYQYLSDYKYSLYIDNICELQRLPSSVDLVSSGKAECVFRAFKHNTRSFLIEEAFAIASLGYDDPKVLAQQMIEYDSLVSMDTITPLTTCTVLLREHNHPAVIKHSNMWWDQVLQFSKRDQMSFDYCRLKSEIDINYLQGNKFSNDLILPHQNVADWRKKASFDEKRYLRLQRELQALRGTSGLSTALESLLKERCHRRDSSLELFSYLNNSPLTSFQYIGRYGLNELQEFLECLMSQRTYIITSRNPATSEAICEIDRCEMLKITNTIAVYLSNHVRIEISPSGVVPWIREKEVAENGPLAFVVILNHSDARPNELWNQLATDAYLLKSKFALLAISFDWNEGINLFMRKNFN